MLSFIEENWGTTEATDSLKNLKELCAFFTENPASELSWLRSIFQFLSEKTTFSDFIKIVSEFENHFGYEKSEEKFLIQNRDGVLHKVEKKDVVLVLDNLRSAFNVGSIFRTAECFGISRILLCGCSATPDNKKVRETSMGCSNFVEWQYFKLIGDAIKYLKNLDYKIVAVETVTTAQEVNDFNFESKSAFVFGNEAYGILNDTLTDCDSIIKIPLQGWKNSLNVGVACGIIAYLVNSSI
ncbi:MAG: TrmH family RNA methyltransferase [Candidatus Cloacimonetes bacterium]|nr:TrmH family RNA methyltransferase [Candidatus Cloacimonadota bacterium]